MFDMTIFHRRQHDTTIELTSRDRKWCWFMVISVLVQSALVIVGAVSVLKCTWKIKDTDPEFVILGTIMYLYDTEACGHPRRHYTIGQLELKSETYGLPLYALKKQEAIMTVSTRLSAKTRKYLDATIVLHVFWSLVAFGQLLVMQMDLLVAYLKVYLRIFYCVFILICSFDMSMAIVYIAHIQQSLTKGMVLRNSGWMDVKLKNAIEFAGWLPMAASFIWLRGILVVALNIYCCDVLRSIRKKMVKKAIRLKLLSHGNMPIPEPMYDQKDNESILYYRTGEEPPAGSSAVWRNNKRSSLIE